MTFANETPAPHMVSEFPTREQFDAMSDAAFCDWWDARCETVQSAATTEAEVVEVFGARQVAEFQRFND